jgi:crotonobetaine/carnitine-CoA ligase
MTELPAYILSPPLSGEKLTSGYCGRETTIWPGFEARLVDEHDREVPTGAAGELIVRSDMPHVIAPGYWNNPEATVQAWRNGWFHTGDVLRKNDDGDYYFVDRAKDCIRRRGENISSAEVEAELLNYPEVGNAAAVAVKSELGEDEVLAVVEPKPNKQIKAAELFQYLVPRMAHYMLPRYIRIMEKMPYTETHKVQKAKLRGDAINVPDVWDRDAAGYRVKRDVVG